MDVTPLSTEEMRVLELNAQYLGITLSMLMQNAGREVARVIESRENLSDKNIAILCGGGGNGGDGLVAARYLYESGANVTVLLLGSEKSISNPDTRDNWQIVKNLDGIQKQELRTERAVNTCSSILKADLLVDAMLGFGLKSAIREPIATAVRKFNDAKAKKYAIDVPTGIDSDTGEVHGVAVKADVTITLHAPKIGLTKATSFAGEVIPVSIGIPPDVQQICGPGDLWLFNRPRPSASKKGDFGRVLIVGGSDVYSGAPALAGMAALRTGADLAAIVAPEPVVAAIRAYSPNLMVASTGTTIFTPEAVENVVKVALQNDVVVIGPGLGRAPETEIAVRELVQKLVSENMRLVVDADGLKALAGTELQLSDEKCVLTPHWGELGILLGAYSDPSSLENRIQQAREAAKRYKATVLLKGPIDVITNAAGRFKLNKTGVPAMTVGGTGDVLTGIVAALLSREKSAFYAAAAGAFVSGRAGELAFAELGNHILATDCIKRIPHVMQPKTTL